MLASGSRSIAAKTPTPPPRARAPSKAVVRSTRHPETQRPAREHHARESDRHFSYACISSFGGLCIAR
jgi:hypothetical protein